MCSEGVVHIEVLAIAALLTETLADHNVPPPKATAALAMVLGAMIGSSVVEHSASPERREGLVKRTFALIETTIESAIKDLPEIRAQRG